MNSQFQKLFQARRNSPVSMLSVLPTTHKMLIIYSCLIGAFNVFEMVLHGISEPAFADWLSWSKPITDLMARFIVGIDQMSDYLANAHNEERAPIIANLMAFDWLISFPVPILGTLTISYDYYHYKQAAPSLFRRIDEADRDIVPLIGLNLILAFFAGLVVYTRIGYVEVFGLYATDVGFLFIAMLFFWFVSTCLFIEALTILLWGFSKRSET